VSASPGDGHFALKRIHLTPPAFEEIPFNPIGGQARCFLVGCGGFAVAMQPSQEIRPRGRETSNTDRGRQ